MKNIALLKRDVELLRQQFKIEVIGDYDEIIIENFPLPENFDRSFDNILLVIPQDFPINYPSIFIWVH